MHRHRPHTNIHYMHAHTVCAIHAFRCGLQPSCTQSLSQLLWITRCFRVLPISHGTSFMRHLFLDFLRDDCFRPLFTAMRIWCNMLLHRNCWEPDDVHISTIGCSRLNSM